jgi:carbon monoxide dehydrogenase subunit G
VTRFQNRNRSEADLPVERQRIWEVLTDPGCLASLTPLIRDITADGDTWCWQLSGISALGVSMAPSFTERMVFTPVERIEYHHAPPAGTTEKAGAEGVYTLSELDGDRTRLFIDLTMWVDLPLPKLSRRAVERVMAESMQRAGDRFAENLYRHLDIDPSAVEIRVPA